MTTPDTTDRRPRQPLLVAGGGLAALVAIGAVLVLRGGSPEDPRPGLPDRLRRGPGGERVVFLEQAPWRIRRYPAGRVADMTARDKRRLRAQSPRVEALVRDLYGALFLRPERAARAVRSRFAGRAARSFRRLQAVGVPARAGPVKTLRRVAKIAVEAPGARRAVASVTVAARGLVGRRDFRLLHDSTLWLERSRGRWSVIAYDVRQEPVA